MATARSGFLLRACADALGLYVVPFCTALLPWPIAFALLKRIARLSFPYREAIDNLWRGAAAYFPAADRTEWSYRARLLLLVEHTDNYLTLLRSDRWWRRHVGIDGEFPAAGQANLFLTCHWGTGNWIWRMFRAQGIGAFFLARRPQGRALGLSRLSRWYGAFRVWSLRRIGSNGVIFTGDSSGAIGAALDAGASLVGMLDVGARAGQQAAGGVLLGRPVRLPCGLVRIAARAGARVTVFSVGLDWRTGRRDLVIRTLPAASGIEAVMADYIAHLDARLQAAPEAWQMWHEAEGVFAAAAAPVAPPADVEVPVAADGVPDSI